MVQASDRIPLHEGFFVQVEGNPAPKGSYRALLIKGKPRLIPMSKREHKWREQIKRACIANGNRVPHGKAVRIVEEFYLPRPKTVKRELPTVPPDIDKLERCLHDGITDSGMWDDDSRIVSVTATKEYARNGFTGVRFTITWREQWYSTRGTSATPPEREVSGSTRS